jgi:hypothetical protein
MYPLKKSIVLFVKIPLECVGKSMNLMSYFDRKDRIVWQNLVQRPRFTAAVVRCLNYVS